MRRVAPHHPTRARTPFLSPPRITTHRSIFMLDAFMLALGLGFFVAGIGYAYACERL
jgi:hypothetical protein